MSAIMHKALNTDPPLPSQITVTCPPAFDGVVRKAMAKRPEDRFQSAAEFLEALQAAAAGRPVAAVAPEEADSEATMVAAAPRPPAAQAAPAARPATAPASVPAAATKRSALPMPMIAAAAAVVVVLLGGGGWFFLAGGPASAPVASVAQNTAPATSGAPAAAPPAAAPAPPAPATPSPTAPASAPTPVQAPPPAQTAQAPASSQPPPSATPATQTTPLAAAPQVASAGLDIIRQQVAQLAASQSCALIDGGMRDGGNVTLTGLAGAAAADALRQSLARVTIPGAVDWRVNSVASVFCPALNALHPTVPAFGAAGPRLGLTLANDQTRLRDGERILPQLVMPDFHASLRVDYVGHDGTVLHLYPQLADAQQHMTADPPRVFQSDEAVRLGDPGPGHPAWEVGPPYGTDMIIAVASSQPLFDRPRPGNVETAANYLRDLQAAVDAAQRRGVQLAGNAITVDTIEK